MCSSLRLGSYCFFSGIPLDVEAHSVIGVDTEQTLGLHYSLTKVGFDLATLRLCFQSFVFPSLISFTEDELGSAFVELTNFDRSKLKSV
ncbi:unnamed protein product [Cylicocyclus nassatus]|uniref:Uncharacterized protein n=1 Tax=Cylicocyclus nassatus TaxID=53992 RepID=A0AA36GC07_CYLNA|nr:unnamed protein product [Cylicocyclus nassatus]